MSLTSGIGLSMIVAEQSSGESVMIWDLKSIAKNSHGLAEDRLTSMDSTGKREEDEE
tara:strand:- start:210 stop:380 length:171 start_codon:yes stop_codon:yes gene_type:complete